MFRCRTVWSDRPIKAIYTPPRLHMYYAYVTCAQQLDVNKSALFCAQNLHSASRKVRTRRCFHWNCNRLCNCFHVERASRSNWFEVKFIIAVAGIDSVFCNDNLLVYPEQKSHNFLTLSVTKKKSRNSNVCQVQCETPQSNSLKEGGCNPQPLSGL